MKSLIWGGSIAAAFLLIAACSSDDDTSIGMTNTGGAGGIGGAAGAGVGGTGPGGEGGASEAGASGVGGAGGAPGVMCDPPPPPELGAGGEGGGAGASGAGLAIIGSYVDEFSGQHTITNSEWNSGFALYHLSAFDNAQHFVIAQNDQNNLYSPCLWSRFDWTVFNAQLYYCTTAFDAASEQAALDTPAANPSSPATGGCGTFPWTALNPQ